MKIESIKTKVNGEWKTADLSHVKVNGTWKDVDTVYVKINGTWVDNIFTGGDLVIQARADSVYNAAWLSLNGTSVSSVGYQNDVTVAVKPGDVLTFRNGGLAGGKLSVDGEIIPLGCNSSYSYTIENHLPEMIAWNEGGSSCP